MMWVTWLSTLYVHVIHIIYPRYMIVYTVGHMLWTTSIYDVGNILWAICCGQHRYMMWVYRNSYCGRHVLDNISHDHVNDLTLNTHIIYIRQSTVYIHIIYIRQSTLYIHTICIKQFTLYVHIMYVKQFTVYTYNMYLVGPRCISIYHIHQVIHGISTSYVDDRSLMPWVI